MNTTQLNLFQEAQDLPLFMAAQQEARDANKLTSWQVTYRWLDTLVEFTENQTASAKTTIETASSHWIGTDIPMTKQKFNPQWPSALADTKEARAQRKRQQYQRQRIMVQRINDALAPIGLSYETLLQGVADGTLGVFVK